MVGAVVAASALPTTPQAPPPSPAWSRRGSGRGPRGLVVGRVTAPVGELLEVVRGRHQIVRMSLASLA